MLFRSRPTVERIHARRAGDLCQELGRERFEALRAEGARVELEEAVRFAFDALD